MCDFLLESAKLKGRPDLPLKNVTYLPLNKYGTFYNQDYEIVNVNAG